MQKVVHDYFSDELTARSGETNFRYSYHYTNLVSLLSILESKEIWMFHANGMNDSSEGRLILDQACVSSTKSRELYDLLIENLYLCSFSNYGNLLSQWRAYGDVSLGFDRDLLETNSRVVGDENGEQHDTSGVQFTSCEYINVDDSHFAEVVRSVRKMIDETPPSPTNEVQYSLLAIGTLCFCQKHSGFREEEESRLVAYLWNRLPKDYNGKKYISYRLDPMLVKRIVIGPSPDQDLKLARIQEFCNGHPEYCGIEVFKSGIPFVDRGKEKKT